MQREVYFRKAFLDTNVLKNIIGDSEQGRYVIELLNRHQFQIATFQKCLYEIYSMIKAIAIAEFAGNRSTKDDPLTRIMSPEIAQLSQKLSKYYKMPISDVYYWYNQCEEWQGWDYFERNEERIQQGYRGGPQEKEARKLLDMQKDFVSWKQLIRQSFRKADEGIKENNIYVYDYFQVYGSEWYTQRGFYYEQDLIKDSFLPNEDFEIIVAAIYSEADVFITNETKPTGIIRRTGASIGSTSRGMSFCSPETLEQAIEGEFTFKFYYNDR
jgi:hypothetical protein